MTIHIVKTNAPTMSLSSRITSTYTQLLNVNKSHNRFAILSVPNSFDRVVDHYPSQNSIEYADIIRT